MRVQGRGLTGALRAMVAVVALASMTSPVAAGGEASMLKDINPSGSSIGPYDAHRLGKRFLFGAASNDGALAQLFRSNGTPSGTRAVRLPFPDDVQDLAVAAGVLYFTAATATKGYELWRSDGTEAGTRLVRDIWPGSEDGNPAEITRLGTAVVMAANHPDSGSELWRSDGTAKGTRLLKDIDPDGSSLPRSLTAGLGFVWFSAVGPTGGRELWRTDGTAAGTRRVKDINPGPAGSDPSGFTVLGKRVYFAATTATHGRELWRSDGTAAGTVRVKDIRDGSAGSDPRELMRMGSSLFFSAQTEAHGRELWRSDGSGATTFRISDTNPSTGDGSPQDLVPIDGTLFFLASPSGFVGALYRTNGTLAGTELVRSFSSFPNHLTRLGSILVFSNNGGDGTGEELWRSDGSEAGTVLAADIRPGSSQGSFPSDLFVMKGVLYFSADDGTHGVEPWRYVP